MALALPLSGCALLWDLGLDLAGAREALIVDLYGTAELFRQDGDGETAAAGSDLRSGDRVAVGANSWCVLRLGGNQYLFLEAGCSLLCDEYTTRDDSLTRLTLERGKLWVRLVQPLEAGQDFVIRAGTLTAAVGEGLAAFDVRDGRYTQCVIQGKVSLKSDSGAVDYVQTNGRGVADARGGLSTYDLRQEDFVPEAGLFGETPPAWASVFWKESWLSARP